MMYNSFETGTATISRLVRKSCGLLLALAAFSGTAWGKLEVPEIDPNTALSSLALLAGGVLLVRDRYRRR